MEDVEAAKVNETFEENGEGTVLLCDWRDKLAHDEAVSGLLNAWSAKHKNGHARPCQECVEGFAILKRSIALLQETLPAPTGRHEQELHKLVKMFDTLVDISQGRTRLDALNALKVPSHQVCPYTGVTQQEQPVLDLSNMPLYRNPSSGFTVYDKLGGWETLVAAVQGLYDKVFGDERMNYLFVGVKENVLKQHMLGFMTAALSGKVRFHPKYLWKVHKDLILKKGANTTHFDLMVHHFKGTLDELGVDKELTANAISIMKRERHWFAVTVDDDMSEFEDHDGGSVTLEGPSVSCHF